MKTMKKMWNCLIYWADTLSRARAAAELTRRGRYKDAQDLMQRTHG